MTNQEASGDLISRQAVIDACEQSINILEAVDRIMDLPSEEQESKTGHWIVSKEKSLARCSNCKFLLKDKDEIKLFDTFVQGYNYCPYCGCKMEGESE